MAVTGYIKLDKKILSWAWYSDASVFKVFIHLLLTAEYKERKIGRIALERGQVFIKQGKIAEENGLSYKQVRGALNCLKDTGEIKMRATNRGTIITICNYTKYQDFVDYQRASKGRAEGEQRASKRASKKAQEKNDNNAENCDIKTRKRASKRASKKRLKKPITGKTGQAYIIYKKIKKEKKKRALTGDCPTGRNLNRSDDFIPGYDF